MTYTAICMIWYGMILSMGTSYHLIINIDITDSVLDNWFVSLNHDLFVMLWLYNSLYDNLKSKLYNHNITNRSWLRLTNQLSRTESVISILIIRWYDELRDYIMSFHIIKWQTLNTIYMKVNCLIFFYEFYCILYRFLFLN